MYTKAIQIVLAYLLIPVVAGSAVVLAQQSEPSSSGIAKAVDRDSRNQITDQPAGLPRLQELIEQALENNPEINAMQRRFDSVRARIPQAKALDEPMLSVGYMGNLTPVTLQTDDPSSGRTISISQDLPFPGKRSLRGKVAPRCKTQPIEDVVPARCRA